jgi:hypothetical protein
VPPLAGAIGPAGRAGFQLLHLVQGDAARVTLLRAITGLPPLPRSGAGGIGMAAGPEHWKDQDREAGDGHNHRQDDSGGGAKQLVLRCVDCWGGDTLFTS